MVVGGGSSCHYCRTGSVRRLGNSLCLGWKAGGAGKLYECIEDRQFKTVPGEFSCELRVSHRAINQSCGTCSVGKAGEGERQGPSTRWGFHSCHSGSQPGCCRLSVMQRVALGTRLGGAQAGCSASGGITSRGL